MKIPSKSKNKQRSVPDGYMCFSLHGSVHGNRSTYTHERREEVNLMRKLGACLRCQLLKKSCSKGDPCTTCLRVAAKTGASRSLAWMECIRPSLLNVSIYGSSAYYDRELQLGGVPVLQYLAHGDVDLKFDIPFQWNIDELSAFVAGWLANDHDAPRASMVGIMSSASLLSVISGLVGAELAQSFKALIYTSSLIFNSTEGSLAFPESSKDVKMLRHCGHRLLQYLETQLRPARLAQQGIHELYALFLMLLGCIISSKYVTESLGDLSRIASGSSQQLSRQQVQPNQATHSAGERGTELVRLLSHQMVYVGQCTGLLREGMDKNLIEDLSGSIWRQKAAFSWELAVEPREHARAEFPTAPCYYPTEECPDVILDCCYAGRLATNPKERRLHSRMPASVVCPMCLSSISTPPQPSDYDTTKTYAVRCLPCNRWVPIWREPGHGNLTDLPSLDIDTPATLDSRRSSEQSDEPLLPQSSMDFTTAIFDPTLPTLGLEIDLDFLDPENTASWPCLNRIPTPPPVLESELELEQQMRDFEQQMDEWMQCNDASFLPVCSNERTYALGLHKQRRLLL